MAAVIGDFISASTRLNHTMIASPSPQPPQHPQPNQGRHREFRDAQPPAHASPAPFNFPPTSASASASTSIPASTERPLSAATAAPRSTTAPAADAHAQRQNPTPSQASTSSPAAVAPSVNLAGHPQPALAAKLAHSGASRFPSPPSSSPTVATDDAKGVSMASQTARDDVSSSIRHAPSSSTLPANTTANNTSSVLTQPGQQQPSPPSDDYHASAVADATDTPQLVPQVPDTEVPDTEVRDDPVASSLTQTVIHIRDLEHVQTLARAEVRAGLGAGTLNDPPLQQMKYEISAMPIGDIIEMVAALLTKITTTNDLQHDAMQRNVTHQQQASQSSDAPGSSLSSLSHSVLAFHGKNVPAITILSYLSRIHRYCPTTYEVFLSLLVYFDRMTERVNERVTRSEEARRSSAPSRTSSNQPLPSAQPAHRSLSLSQQATQENPQRDTPMRDEGESEDSDESDSELADDDDDDDDEMEDSSEGSNRVDMGRIVTAPPPDPPLPAGPATYFVVDSFNIHRLIIAGVTCASKFFSDVFYTNSRYAKVGGLPLAELNHLELQFLVLNDFRLAVPVEDLEAYATMLVEFYAREVVGRAPLPASDD